MVGCQIVPTFTSYRSKGPAGLVSAIPIEVEVSDFELE